MKFFKKVVIPARDVKVVDYEECDICGEKSKNGQILDDWYGRCYQINNVKIRHKRGEAYPDNGRFIKTSFSICPKCFTDKVIPFIKSFKDTDPLIENKDW